MPADRVLLLTEIFPPKTGGSGRWLWELYRRLSQARIVIAAGMDPRQEGFDRSHSLRVERRIPRFTSWGIANPSGFLSYGKSLAAVWKLQGRYDVTAIHAARCVPEGLVAWAARRLWNIPYLCYVHGEELAIYAQSRELRWLARRAIKGADLFIANSQNTFDLLQRDWEVPVAKLRLLNPGVDTGRFIPAAGCSALRKSYGWSERRVILTVSRLQKRKGHDVMIQALPQIIREFPDVLYSVVGDGAERDGLQALVNRMGLGEYVQFRGELNDDDVIRCYQQCDLFVLPNRTVDGDFEGFGMVLLEAQACGKAVIAGDSGGTAETMLRGRTGEIVACENGDQLAVTVTRLLRDPAGMTAMGAAGREWVSAHFDWDPLARRAAELLGIPMTAIEPRSIPAGPASTDLQGNLPTKANS